MNYILFDNFRRENLLPLTFVRPIAEIRIGILTIREKWERYLDANTTTLTEDYLREKYPLKKEEDNILINASVCPNDDLVKKIIKLKPNQALSSKDIIVAIYLKSTDLETIPDSTSEDCEEIEIEADFLEINNTWDIFGKNERAIIDDFSLICKNRKSAKISDTNKIIGKENIFVEEGAKIEYAIINASAGPVYIGKNAEVMEGSIIRGPFALCEHSVVKMSAKIYGPTTIGPHSKVGGELNNVVIFGYSNKAHDGFLGNAVIAEWCNLGADTNNSNLKNNYKNVRIWNYAEETFVDTGLQFCGLIMGDHSKCGINTMFNTGTVIGVNTNLFGSGFQRNFVPGFTLGGTQGYKLFNLKLAFEVAEAVFKRRNVPFNEIEQNILRNIYEMEAGK